MESQTSCHYLQMTQNVLREAGLSDEFSSLQKSIDMLQDWAKKWSMDFNTSKCSVIHMGPKNPKNKYYLNDQELKVSSSEKDVGIIVQEDLKFNEHYQKISKKCNQIMGQIWRSFKHKDQDIMIRIFNTYLLPHVDYGAVVWSPYLKKDIQKIENIQRKYTRMIFGMKGLSYEERLEKLGLQTLEQRRIKLDLIQAYKIKNDIDHVQGTLFTLVKDSSQRSTRSSCKEDFSLKASRTDMRRNFFSQRVVKHWNKLPAHVQGVSKEE